MELKMKTPRRSTTLLRFYKGIFRNIICLNRFMPDVYKKLVIDNTGERNDTICKLRYNSKSQYRQKRRWSPKIIGFAWNLGTENWIPMNAFLVWSCWKKYIRCDILSRIIININKMCNLFPLVCEKKYHFIIPLDLSDTIFSIPLSIATILNKNCKF